MLNRCKEWMGKTPRTWMYVVGVILFIAAFSLLAYRTSLTDVWMPPSMDSDEVSYNRQIASVITHGGPQGYFGYNEDHAPIGRYSTWGPVVIWVYALPALLFGSSVNTVFWCNILFGVLGLILFVRAARLTVGQSLLSAGLLVCLWTPLTMMFCGSASALHNALALVAVGASAALWRQYHPGWFAVAAVACTISTISRPYELLLWVFPLVALWHSTPRRRVICLGIAALSFVAALLNMSVLAAKYFDGYGVDTQALALFFQGDFLGAFAYQWEHIDLQLRTVRMELIHSLQGEWRETGSAIVAYLVFLAATVGCLVYDLRRKRAVRFKLCALFNAVATGILLIVVYSVMARHLLLACLLMLAALALEDMRPALVYLPLIAILLLPTNARRTTLPTYFPLMGEQIEQVNEVLSERMAARDSDDPWDATLAYAYDDGVIHGYLYGVPDGMGIEFDWNKYMADPQNPIYSRYAMVGHGTEAEARLIQDGWKQLLSAEELVLYERSDAPA